MTSIGKRIQYRCGGCYRPVTLKTKPGTVTHAVYPVTQGNCTNFIAKQIIEAFWSALSQAVPQEAPAGWGSINYWVFAGLDTRRMEGYGSPDFQGCGSGAGAIWGVDGWPTNGPQICSGTLYYPEIEIVEGLYPIIWDKWQWATDSAGAGKWRGGCGVENEWVCDSAQEPMHLAYAADPFDYEPAPAIAGGQMPPPNSKSLLLADGTYESPETVRQKMIYLLRKGDKAMDLVQGGAGVGYPLERDPELVLEDVRDELVSLEAARSQYGVVIDPATWNVDRQATQRERQELAAKAGRE
jgi:N-methylhydantoinase B